MKEIKTYKITLFIIGVILLLSPIVYLIPEDGWNIKIATLKFLSKENFLNPKKQEKADISKLISDVDTNLLLIEPIDSTLIKKEIDSSEIILPPIKKINISEIPVVKIQINNSGKELMKNFFERLNGLRISKEKISILHYGDSQIEGDRMTSYIRQRIQDQFGGNGPGLIPANDVYNSFSFNQDYSDNFIRYTAFGGKKLREMHYGVMGSVARFTPEYKLDSTFTVDSLIEQTAWIEFGPSNVAYPRAKSYNNVTMHYNQCVYPTKVIVTQNNNTIHEEELKSDSAYHILKLSLPSNLGKIRYTFTGKISPNICGFSLDGSSGVQVSNIAMRGSSGTIFRRLKRNTLIPMYRTLNTKMVIMQYGGNSIPFFKDSSGVENFANYFKSQINSIKRMNPNLFVIVIGPSDMSKLKDGIYNTYKLLPYCVEKMKEATVASGSGYWDLYSAMGGENSMPAWVEKGLAGNDHIHFSSKGAKIASQMFYDALISEYVKWNNNN